MPLGYAIRRLSRRLVVRSGYRLVRDRDPVAVSRELLGQRPVRTIFDVGANVGQTAVRYRRAFPEATLYCVEPFRDSFETLRARFADDPRVRPVHGAFGDAAGTRRFYVGRDSKTSSLLGRAPGAGAPEPAAEHEVRVHTLDDFCDKNAVEAIDILKLDVEGAELLVLNGALRTLREQRIPLVFTEVMFVPHYAGQALFHDLAAFLAGHGYTVFDLYDLRHGAGGQLRYGNALFLHATLRSEIEARGAGSK